MKKKIDLKKIAKLLTAIIISIYILCIFINQQKTINLYKTNKEYYTMQLNEQKQYQEELTELKNNINSPEYIQEIAREKLDMYLPNERVYIDIGQ